MFASQRGGFAGLGGIVGVALVAAAWAATVGAMWATYRNGGAVQQDGSRCQLICHPAVRHGAKG